jgi:hypothetical protein
VRVFSAVALAVSLSTGLALSVLAVLVCVQLEPLPSLGEWSPATLRAKSGMPWPVGFVALVIVGWCLTAALLRAIRSGRTLWAAARAAEGFTSLDGDLVVIDDQAPTAYTVSAIRGPVVVSTGMLAALSADERRVLIAHERSHLRHRHYLYLHVARLAAAANPLLASTSAAVTRGVERWADEEAAAEVGDRALAARALARAALATAGLPSDGSALAVTGGQVAERARLLLAPPLPARPFATFLLVVSSTVSVATALLAMVWLRDLVELAESVYLCF